MIVYVSGIDLPTCQHLWLLKSLLEAWRILKAHGVKYFTNIKRQMSRDYPDSPTVRGNGFGDCIQHF